MCGNSVPNSGDPATTAPNPDTVCQALVLSNVSLLALDNCVNEPGPVKCESCGDSLFMVVLFGILEFPRAVTMSILGGAAVATRTPSITELSEYVLEPEVLQSR
jgi:hypothetical protein